MNTKLTLTLEKEIIELAKDLAKKSGQSLSEIVENHLKHITQYSRLEQRNELSPKVKSLRGILKVDGDFDYKKVLEEELMKKYG